MTDLEDLLRAVEEAEIDQNNNLRKMMVEQLDRQINPPFVIEPGWICYVNELRSDYIEQMDDDLLPDPWPWYIIYPTIFFSTFFGFTGFYWVLYLWRVRHG